MALAQQMAVQAIGYVRVSTEEQAREGVSLDAQRQKIIAYCDLHGLALTDTHADEGLSGSRADNRPGLQEAIATTCKSQGVLIVYSLSRLVRSTRDAIEIAERLDRCNANLVSITERIDTTTAMGRFFFTTIAALAQLERDQISERTVMALAHKRSKRERTSGIVPYGYRLGEDGLLVEDSREQRVLVLIRHMRKNGWSTRRIGAELVRLGLPPRTGTHWHPKVVMGLNRRTVQKHTCPTAPLPKR